MLSLHLWAAASSDAASTGYAGATLYHAAIHFQHLVNSGQCRFAGLRRPVWSSWREDTSSWVTQDRSLLVPHDGGAPRSTLVSIGQRPCRGSGGRIPALRPICLLPRRARPI